MSPQQLIPLIAILIALPLILLRNRRPRILRPQWLWVMPTVIVLLMALALWGTSMDPNMPHTAFDTAAWAILATGLVLVGVFGWWSGRMTTI